MSKNKVTRKSKSSPRKRGNRKSASSRKNRLALILTPIAIIVILVMVIFSNFGNPGEIYRGISDPEEHVTEATEAGRRDAERVLHTASGSMERDQALLFLHSRASALRLAGYSTAADDYMEGARDFLRSRKILD